MFCADARGRRRALLPLPLPRAAAAGHGAVAAPRAACSGVLCASIGSIQVNEAIKLLTGIGDPLVGKLVIYDALEMEYRKLKVRKDPNCALCGENPTVTELIDYDAFCGAISEEAADAAAGSTISVTQLEHMLKERDERRARLRAGRRPRAERVRDQQDPRLGADPQGRLPQRQRASSELPAATSRSCCTARPACARPRRWRSLKGAGYADAVHVGGGVVAWVNQIDPSQPSY